MDNGNQNMNNGIDNTNLNTMNGNGVGSTPNNQNMGSVPNVNHTNTSNINDQNNAQNLNDSMNQNINNEVVNTNTNQEIGSNNITNNLESQNTNTEILNNGFNTFNSDNLNNNPINQNIGGIPEVNSVNNTNTSSEQPKNNGAKWIIIAVAVIAVVAVLVGSLFYEKENKEQTPVVDNNTTTATKILVAYFSKDGQNLGSSFTDTQVVLEKGYTEQMAEKIANYIGADLYEIVPATAYPDDLNELYTLTQKELNDDTYPAIKNSIDLSEYGTIFIGYPIWHQTYPQIIKTFVKDNPTLKEKTIVPFNTHVGAGSAGTYETLKTMIGTNNFLEGYNVNGALVPTSDEEIKQWLINIGFEIKNN